MDSLQRVFKHTDVLVGFGMLAIVCMLILPMPMWMLDAGLVAAIAGAVIAMAHSLKMEVVAEGVEDSEQLALLRKAGCDLGQGYLFSRPLQAQPLMAWLQRPDGGDAGAPSAALEREAEPVGSLPSSLAG